MAIDDDSTVQVLRDIHKAIQGINSRLHATNRRLDDMANLVREHLAPPLPLGEGVGG